MLTPDAIFAHYDGSGAGGSFLPCVTYYTQDGKVFARAFPAAPVAAGASADVSFFPGLSQSPSPSGIVLLAETLITAPAGQAAISFTAIPQNYRHLEVWARVGVSSNGASKTMTFRWNGTTITTYNYVAQLDGATLVSSQTSSATEISTGAIFNTTASTGLMGSIALRFPFYALPWTGLSPAAVPTVQWTGTGFFGDIVTGAGNAGTFTQVTDPPAQPIASLTFTAQAGSIFMAGTRFALYGIA